MIAERFRVNGYSNYNRPSKGSHLVQTEVYGEQTMLQYHGHDTESQILQETQSGKTQRGQSKARTVHEDAHTGKPKHYLAFEEKIQELWWIISLCESL